MLGGLSMLRAGVLRVPGRLSSVRVIRSFPSSSVHTAVTRFASGASYRNVATASPVLTSARTFSSAPPPTPQQTVAPNLGASKPHAEHSDKHSVFRRLSFYQRFKTIMKLYGWWALGIYSLLSGIDLTLTFAGIHFLGGEHVEELEALLYKWIGPMLKKLKKEEEPKENTFFTYVKGWFTTEEKANEMEHLIARLSGEFVLAFAIHKTFLVPVRAGLTILITPGIVRWLIKRGLARPLKTTASTAI